MFVEKPMISVIIPVYNAEKYISQCYLALQKQTYDNLELIFVDDASKDKSITILEGFAQADSRVRIIRHSENRGVSAARNTGLAVCRGDYIGFCDADDECAPSMFSSMMGAISRNDADVACCAINRATEQGKIVATLWESKAELVMDSAQAIKYWLIGKFIGNSVCTKLMKKTLLEEVRFPEGEIFEEAKVIPQVLANAKSVVHTGKADYTYYIHSNSITTKPIDERVLSVYKREEFIRKYILSRFPSFEEALMSFEVRNNIPLMMSAEISRASITNELYREISAQFDRVFKEGLTNRYVSLKNKIHLLEVKMGIFAIRKGLR